MSPTFIEDILPDGSGHREDAYPGAELKSDLEMEVQIGEQIGHGTSRDVFLAKGDNGVVIKKVHLVTPAANFIEHILWNAVRGTKYRDTFGRVHAISVSGRYLMMERLGDISKADYRDTPDVPDWFNDNQPSNFGKNANGQIKIRDYAIGNLGSALGGARSSRAAWQRVKST